MRLISFFLRLIWILFLAFLVFLNARLYAPSPLARDENSIPSDIVMQLNACRSALEHGSAKRMQELFPEGYVFSYLFHGLTWVEVGLRDPSYREHAISEARWALTFVQTEAAKAPFPENLPPEHGMFYAAWKANLQAGIVLLQAESEAPLDANSNEMTDLQESCDTIANCLENSETPYPPSYVGSAWPCDTLPAIHALVTYDHITQENRYAKPVHDWRKKVNSSLDVNGLIPHTTNPSTGEPLGLARATSQTIILRMLPDIDPIFATQQYETYRDHFYSTLIEIPSVLEYPKGVSGEGDVDTGPLIFGRSLSANVFAIGIAQIYGDQAWADAIAQTGEAIGLPWTSGDQKRYAFGILPIGEQMVAYAYVARPWFAEMKPPESKQPLSIGWRLPLHGISSIPVILTCWVIYRRRKSKG